MTSFCFRVLFLLLPFCAMGQLVDDVIFQPAIKIVWHNNSRWSFNTALEQRNNMTNEVDPLHINLTQFANYEIGFYSQIGLGVMYRELFDENNPEELRVTEQFVHAKKYNQFKVAHRLRWDQRLRSDRVTHRWRYQLSGSLPLSGNKIDTSEYYLTANLETLLIAENNVGPAYDQRLGFGLGKQLETKYKLQLNTEYRWEQFTTENQRSLFIYLSLYANL